MVGRLKEAETMPWVMGPRGTLWIPCYAPRDGAEVFVLLSGGRTGMA